MENIILTNNKDLRLVSVKVGVLSTLRFELPLVSASATHVEVIVTSGNVHSAYTATFIDDTKRWQCDIAASQFPAVGKQSYEIAYVLDGKQFWDGKGWIEIEDATTSGIEPQPRPEPYRYAVVSVNGYGADEHGAVRIPKTFIAANSPVTTEGFMEGDIFFNRETGATWTLCNVQGTLTWVFNYKNYYTKAETEEAIDRVAAYYITYTAAGAAFPTYAALANATTVYSGGKVRVPTRNDYCVVLADETHDNAEYRYIYAVAEGQTTGSWQPQFPVEGVMTVDQSVTKNSQNPVASSGIWSALWGALSALPTGFTSLYDWCVSQLAGKASKSDVDPLLFAQYYPDGSVKSAAEFTQGIKYDTPDTVNRTITVKPFCNTGTAENDNSGLVGRVVIPPFVDAQGNPYISDDGTRFKVVGVSGSEQQPFGGGILTAIVAPDTVTAIGVGAFYDCTALNSVSLPAVMDIGNNALSGCTTLAFVSFPTTATIGNYAFNSCTSLTSVSLPAATSIGDGAFGICTSLASVDFGDTPRSSVPTLGNDVFDGVPTSCRIIVPYMQYNAWIAAENWRDLPQEFVRHAEKADKPATFTTGNLAKFDADGNPTDSGKKPSDFQSALSDAQLANIAAVPNKANAFDLLAKLDSISAAPAFSSDSSVAYAAGAHVTYNGKLYVCTTATTGGTWVARSWYLAVLPKLPAVTTPGNLLSFGYGSVLTDSTIPAANVAVKGNIPYSLGTPTVIDTASSETVEGETVYFGAATLANRTANIVQVTAATALDELRITFPAATNGKVRDFGLRVEIGTGSAALAAPALVPIAPTGETIKIENADGTIPELADGTATAKGVTLLYFSETAPGVFVVKGEQVEEVA